MRTALTTLLLTACSCGGSLRVDGDHGYVRCHADEAPPERVWHRGSLQLSRSGRELTIGEVRSGWRLAAIRGEGTLLSDSALDLLRNAHVDLIALLGGLGDDSETARRNADALERLGPPIVFVAGGRDQPRVFATLLAGRDGLVDVTRLRAIHAGSEVLIPVPGAASGRYARSNEACGLGEEDIEEWPSSPAGSHRILLSWSGPSPLPGLLGIDAGSSLVASIARRTGADHAVFAWPTETSAVLLAGVETPLILESGEHGLVPASP